MIKFIVENVAIFIGIAAFHGRHKDDPVELLTEFKEKFRNRVAHSISLTGKGRWPDHALQTVAILSCEVVALLGGNCDDVSAAREKVEKMIQKSMSISTAAAGVSTEGAKEIG
ncbi:hypothetical protein BC938DRAFT_474154, partial [Jimgerdemannia flammicorona]